MTDDLISWLRTQLDADEREIVKHPDNADEGMSVGLWATEESEYPNWPVLRMSKTRAVTEVQAKRAILDTYDEATDWYERNRSAPAGEVHGLRTAIKHLASVYADRPGYQEQWKP